MIDFDSTLAELEHSGNLRRMPDEIADRAIVDLSSNDYLGLADDVTLRERFLATHPADRLFMTSSASRLLAARQQSYARAEHLLADSYGHGKCALLFNSGYHANVGLVSSLAASPPTLIVADKLVHASIIDGIKLSGAPFERFRHNNYEHLGRILAKNVSRYQTIIIIVESVYSMDGDKAHLQPLVELKRRYANQVMLYVDEAHAVGVEGPAGLGCAAAEGVLDDIDVIVGTMGKALASSGAWALTSQSIKQFLINRARSLIFSTALPPAQVDWSALTWRASLEADDRRDRLRSLAVRLAEILPGAAEPSHIRPLIVGDARLALQLSGRLLEGGFKVLPIRTPTVPPGTERLRFSLSASIVPEALDRLAGLLTDYNIEK